MSQDQAGPDRIEVPSEVFDRLDALSPAERTDFVLRSIEQDREGRLRLPADGGRAATLDGIDLSPSAVASRFRGDSPPSTSWDAERGGLDLRGADLRGVRLRGADLRSVNLAGADLSEADLDGADLGGASLRDARLTGCRMRRANLEGAELAGAVLERVLLEEARLAGTDFAGVNLAGVLLGEADLRGTMFEEADLRGASLRFADLRDAVLEGADVRKADLWGANLERAVLEGADLREARFVEANLRGANLARADLRGCTATKTDLRGADLRGADLREAVLAGANLREASLAGARLQEVSLAGCDITHVGLGGAKLHDTQLDLGQLGGAIGEELARDYEAAAQGYLALERNFEGLGDHDAASWAYRRRRRMQKRDALAQARAARSARRWRTAAGRLARYAGNQCAEWVCDYGESVPRVLGSLLVLYAAFTVLYGLTGSVVRDVPGPDGVNRVVTRNPVDLAIFSLLAMTTGTVGIELLPRDRLALTLIGIQVFLGIAMTGLLGFVLGNRIRR